MSKVTVITLTEAGHALAGRLTATLPEAEFLHRPEAFRDTVRVRFRSGHRLVMICATGIVVRTLAPVLGNKHSDPAVLVLDEKGQYVVPLISGHEGGANEWARELAEALGAQCVVTGARSYTHPVLVVGLGCERDCPRESLRQLMLESLSQQDLATDEVTAVASIDLKMDERGLLDLCADLGKDISFYPAAHLRRFTGRLSERSEVVFQATGCYGVAEAAALAHAERLAGGTAELVIRKRKGHRATFALARAFRD